MKKIWESMSPRARLGFGTGAVLILLLVGWGATWALEKDYEVLFADLNPQDAAAMAAELERLKQPHEIAENGTAILVPPDAVARTRLKLVAKNLPAHGGVGFEIFNDTDYGMTEFAQKVNYQRALQGELTRTILALDEIQSARVHLALPESGLFKRDGHHAKASVTLAMKAGRALEKEEIAGIQRLVAAAVPDMEAKDVTIVNSAGSALNAADRKGEEDGGDWKLDAKRQVEAYLDRKLTTLIDKAVGAGRGAVTVDAQLNFDNVKVTAEELLPGAEGDQQGAGVRVRERTTSRPASGASAPAGGGAGDAVTNSDVEYAVGRRVQQVVSTPGSIERISVGVILPPEVGPAQADQLRQVLGAAAGLDKERGDSLALYVLSSQAAPGSPQAVTAPMAEGLEPVEEPVAQPLAGPRQGAFVWNRPWLGALLVGVLTLALAALAWRARGAGPRQAGEGDASPPLPPLTEAQRQKVLADVRAWLAKQVAA